MLPVALYLIAMPHSGAMPHVGGQVAVIDFKTSDVRDALLPVLTEVLTTEVANSGVFDGVLAGRDIQQMLSFEEKKQMLGCDDTSCLAEIGGALGVDRLIVPQVARVSDAWVVTLKQIDIRGASTEGRVYERFAGDEGALLDGVRASVGKLLGAPAATTSVAIEPESSIPVVPIAFGAAALASAGVGVAFALKASGHEANASDPTFVGGQREIVRAHDAARVANIAYGGAALFAVGGVVAWLLSGSSDDERDVVAAFGASGDGASVSVAGRF